MREHYLPDLDRRVKAILEYTLPQGYVTIWDVRPDGYIVMVMPDGKATLFPTYAQASDIFEECVKRMRGQCQLY